MSPKRRRRVENGDAADPDAELLAKAEDALESVVRPFRTMCQQLLDDDQSPREALESLSRSTRVHFTWRDFEVIGEGLRRKLATMQEQEDEEMHEAARGGDSLATRALEALDEVREVVEAFEAVLSADSKVETKDAAGADLDAGAVQETAGLLGVDEQTARRIMAAQARGEE